MENYILPKLQDHAGDIAKRWYVEYKYKLVFLFNAIRENDKTHALNWAVYFFYNV